MESTVVSLMVRTCRTYMLAKCLFFALQLDCFESTPASTVLVPKHSSVFWNVQAMFGFHPQV